jgi:hypothetical protein
MIKHVVLAGFTLAVAITLGPPCSATHHPADRSQGTETFAGVPQIAAPQQLDEVAWRIRRLTDNESLEQSRTASEKNPLLLADVGHYQVELANARRAQAVAAQK